MKTAKELFSSEKEDGIEYADYQPILNEFGEILLQVDDSDYQGDSRLLYRDNNKIGYLNFGWGSCSGCDALQACDTIEEVQDLMDYLYNMIKWFDSKKEALNFFNNHDWKGDYSYNEEEQIEFINKAKEILKTYEIANDNG
jgi:hypothetical protein